MGTEESNPDTIRIPTGYGDACVIPFPRGNTTKRRFAYELGIRGFTSALADGIVSRETFSFSEQCTVALLPASFLSGQNRDIAGIIRQKKKKNRLYLVPVNENKFVRTMLKEPAVFGLHDYHQSPRDAFDRVCAKMAAERNIAVDISIRPLIMTRGWERQKIIRRYGELVRLWHRYRFPLLISTHAGSVPDIRSPLACISLCNLIGLDKSETDDIMRSFPDLLSQDAVVMELP
ncbi:MAG: hypothetical protein JXA44_13865 [Methanospirillaceae archaeon]|nr:hypothetical protein [Methanospirillaceae archaeon]